MYLLFGGPALAVILVYPITRLRSSWLRLGTFLLVIMFEMDGINWGFEEGPVVRDVSIRSLAILTKASASPSQIVVIDEGYGRSNPASAVYELDPKTLMVCFGRGSDPEKLWSMVRDYHDVWIVRSFDDETETMAIRKELDKRFQESPSFKKDFENHSVTRFLRAAGAVPENTELKEN